MSLLAATTAASTSVPYMVPPYPIPSAPPYNVDHWLQFPDPYGHDGSVVHPDILDMGSAGWRGFRYWMVATPYWMQNAREENPSMWASHDVMHWRQVGTNPVYPPPVDKTQWNSDPDLVHDPSSGQLVMFFRGGGFEHYVARSSDGVTWPANPTPITLPGVSGQEVVSPTVLLIDGTWWLWGITNPDRTMFLWTAPSPEGPWTNKGQCSGWSGGWHMNAIRHQGIIYMLVATFQGNLICNTSKNGLTWTCNPSPSIVVGRAGAWDSDQIYRPSIVLDEDKTTMHTWYSGRGPGSSSWRLAYTRMPISAWPAPPA